MRWFIGLALLFLMGCEGYKLQASMFKNNKVVMTDIDKFEGEFTLVNQKMCYAVADTLRAEVRRVLSAEQSKAEVFYNCLLIQQKEDKAYEVKTYDDGTKCWFLKGQTQHEDSHFCEYTDGDKVWWFNGKFHREDGPAVEWVDGSKFWWINDKLHREDGPACEYANGDKYWYLNGQRHREDGPAIEWADGSKWWYLNGKLHREDGPAVMWNNGHKAWFLNGIAYTEEEFNKKTKACAGKIVEIDGKKYKLVEEK